MGARANTQNALILVETFFQLYPENDRHSIVAAFSINNNGAQPTDKPFQFKDHIKQHAESDPKLRKWLQSLSEKVSEVHDPSEAPKLPIPENEQQVPARLSGSGKIFSRSQIFENKGSPKRHLKSIQPEGDPIDSVFNSSLAARKGFSCANRDTCLIETEDLSGDSEYLFMHTNAEDLSRALDEATVALSCAILEDGDPAIRDEAGGQYPVASVGEARQTPVVITGRVACDSEGKLNVSSVMLEGVRGEGGQSCQLWLSGVGSYFLYPGQVVAAVGVSSTDEHAAKFIASHIVDGVSVPPPTLSEEAASTANERVSFVYQRKILRETTKTGRINRILFSIPFAPPCLT
eukprot:GHVN01083393.1.p1 GENE.GHVN01083393.1~~GHVN01083393.1.p1  ORF type:complete len:348 (+),score=41.60 GHVN01083393.1:195-1238(+)